MYNMGVIIPCRVVNMPEMLGVFKSTMQIFSITMLLKKPWTEREDWIGLPGHEVPTLANNCLTWSLLEVFPS